MHLTRIRFVFLPLLIAVTSTFGQSLTWTSGSGNVLTNSANWGGTVPTSAHTLIFNNVTTGTNANITLAGGSLSANSMSFNNTGIRVSAALGTNSGNGVIAFGNATTLITASNTSSVNFTSVNTTTTNATVPTLTIQLNFSGNGTINTVDAGSSVAFWSYTNGTAANITGTGGLIKTGAGTLRLGNAHTYSGGLDLQQGVVEVMQNATGTSSAFGSGSLTLSGGTLMSNSTAARAIDNNTRFNGTVTLGNATNTGALIFQTGAATLLSDSHLITPSNVNLNQAISGAFKLSKSGNGMLFLGTNANLSTFSGGFELSGGTVQVANSGANSSAGAFGTGALILSGGTVTSNNTTSKSFANAVTLNGTVTIGTSGTGTIIFNNTTSAAATLLSDSTLNTVANLTWQQPLSGTASLTKNGTGALTFGTSASASTYSGGFELKEGSVTLSSSGNSTLANAQSAFGTGTLRLSGGTVVSSNTQAGGDRFIYNAVVFNGTVTLGDAASLAGLTLSTGWGNSATVAADSTLHTPGATILINQEISGSANLTKTGAGTLNISDSNPNFTGNLFILGGTVSVDAPGNLGANSLSRTTVIDNATLRFTGTTASGNNRTYSLGAGGGTFEVTSSGVSINGSILDYNDEAGHLIKTGTGILTLSATNSYSGGTTVLAGTLAGTSSTIQGDVTNNAVVNFNQNTSGTYSGNITGTGTLTKTGTGVLTLSGSGNTLDSGTTVAAGGLRVEGTLGGTVTVDAGADFSGSGYTSGAVTIAGTHSPGSSPGIQSFGSSLTYAEGAAVNLEFNANTSTQNLDTPRFDQIVVAGALDFAGATSVNLSFNGSGSTVNWHDAFWSANQSWRIYETASVAGFGNLSLVTGNWEDASGKLFETVLTGSSFSFTLVGNDIYLSYSAAAIPEPSTYAALLGLAGFALVLVRRRRTRR